MPINAQLLQIGDLSGVLQRGQDKADAQWANNMNSMASLAQTGASAYNQYHVNEALSNNFDPATGKVNQQGVIKDLYAINPQIAQKMAQDFQTQSFANQKAQGDINKTTAETGKLGAETSKIGAEAGGVNLKNIIDQNNQLGQMVLGVNSQESLNKTLAFAKSKGLDTSLYENAAYTPELKKQVMAQIVDANNQVKNQIDQQNANSGTMNALTNQQTSNQNYEVNTNKNIIDNRKAATDEVKANAEVRKIDNEIQTKGMVTPTQALEFSKAQNELQKTQIETSNKVQSGINNLNKANKIIDLFSDNATKILNNPLVSGGIDPETGKVYPNKDNDLGGLWANLRSNDSTINPFNKTDNEYGRLKAEYDRLALQARGKGLQDLKALSSDGSAGLGGTSNDEGKMLGVMQNIPDFASFIKLSPQERVDTVKGIVDAAKEDKESNLGLINRAKSQGGVIQNQSVPQAPQTRGQLPQSMPVQTGNVPVGAPLRDKAFTASNGYVLTPAMYAKIAAMQGK